MRTCEFCATSFEARPQTKNPRACQKAICQKKRQRQNEKNWHQRHKNYYLANPKYHQEKRVLRHKLKNEIINCLLDAVLVGFKIKGIKIKFHLFEEFFSNFIHRVGIRKINKFYLSLNPPINSCFDNTT